MDGRFVDPDDVAAEEEEVEAKRKKPARKRTKGTSAKLDDDVLDECEESFIAAQEKVTKASKNYYADTGLMAILCRHDRVLYVANMTTPGERQHFALVLLRKVLEGLPQDWMVGVLYDIACQLSRSIEKVRILADDSLCADYLLARSPARLRGSANICRVRVPCLWPPMGLPNRVPPAQEERLRADGR